MHASPTPRSDTTTTTDRLAVAFLSGLVALGTSALVWVSVLYVVGPMPFWPFWIFIACMVVIGFALRTNLLLSLFARSFRLAREFWSTTWL
jgi:hypothetical protein